MEHRIDISPERIEELQRAIEEIKREDREVWGNYQSEYRIAEYPGGLYIELVPYREEHDR